MIKIDEVEKVYSGKPGCACGCLGKYWTTGPMVKRLVDYLNAYPAEVRWDDTGAWAELARYNPDGVHVRDFVVYFKGVRP